MISFIIGEIDSIDKNSVIINNNGIGYEIKISDAILNKIISWDQAKKIKLYTFTSVKEDSICLYGFLSLSQLQTFNQLITVSGIGPKAAMNILANMSDEDVLFSIANEDSDALSKIPGVGKKTAQRLILELKDKINIPVLKNHSPSPNNNSIDAINALCSLGYNRSDVTKIIMGINTDSLSTQDIIKQALKFFAK